MTATTGSNRERLPAPPGGTGRLAGLVFVTLFACNLLFFSGRFHSVDEMALLANTESLVKWQRVDINSLTWAQWFLTGPDQQGLLNRQGDLQAKKAPLVSWLAVPLYASAGWFHARQVQASMLLNALAVALTGALLFRFARSLGWESRIAVAGALLFGLGTGALVYARHLFSEPLAGLGLLLAVEGMWRFRAGEGPGARALAQAGAGLALAALSNFVYFAFVPVTLAAQLWPCAVRDPARGAIRPRLVEAALLLWPVGLAGAAAAVWSAIRFGSLWTTGYHWGAGEGFTSPLGITIPALLVSPARGLFWFSPATLLAVAGVRSFLRRDRGLAALILGLVTAHLLLFGAWWMWWGGWGWGPRFLVPVLPLLIVLSLPALERAGTSPGWRRRIVLLVCAVSVAIQILGACVGFDEIELAQSRTQMAPAGERAVYPFGMSGLWGWSGSPISEALRLLLSGRIDLAWCARGSVDWLLLLPLLLWLGVCAWRLRAGLREKAGPAWRAVLLAGSALALVLLLGRAHGHPLRASYGFDPTIGAPALDQVAQRSRPGDGVLLVRALTPGEMDLYPGFPRTYGIPDARLAPAGPGPDLDRLLALARSRHDRLWLIVRTERDPVTAEVAARLQAAMRPSEATTAGAYSVMSFTR